MEWWGETDRTNICVMSQEVISGLIKINPSERTENDGEGAWSERELSEPRPEGNRERGPRGNLEEECILLKQEQGQAREGIEIGRLQEVTSLSCYCKDSGVLLFSHFRG